MDSRQAFREAVHRPVYLLWLLREHTIESIKQLCEHFAPHSARASHYLIRPLDRLHRANLIVWDQKNGKIKITSTCHRVLDTLEASLTELANRSYNSMTVDPLFPRPIETDKRVDVFVLMPFAADLKPIYDDHLKQACEECELSIARADDFFNTNEVMTDIWQAIVQSRVIIADCTGRNPNVFYELGIAHTVGKPVILVTQNEDDIPFDIRHRRYIKYTFTPRGMKELETSLSATLQEILSGSVDGRPRHGGFT